MKTLFKNLIAIGISAMVVLGTTWAARAGASNNTYTVFSSIKNISKIDVSGNVELIIIQDVEENIKVYNNYYASNALVQEKDGLLRISSFSKEKLIVVVHVRNLSVLSAQDESSVKTHGNFQLLDLAINLKDKAKAEINAQTVNLHTKVSGTAFLKITGIAEDYSASIADAAGLNLAGFRAAQSSIITQKIPGCRLSQAGMKTDETNSDVQDIAYDPQ